MLYHTKKQMLRVAQFAAIARVNNMEIMR